MSIVFEVGVGRWGVGIDVVDVVGRCFLTPEHLRRIHPKKVKGPLHGALIQQRRLHVNFGAITRDMVQNLQSPKLLTCCRAKIVY